jgi:HAE1 family hydrophobic/amphiphilic exporter-1
VFISDTAIRRPVITVVVTVALVAFGVLALTQLQTDEVPEVTPPVVSVTVPYPGASPQTVETEVVDPVEEAISSISGVKEIRSTSLDGFAILTVEFVFEKDVQQATQDVRDAISRIRNDLPTEMEEPVLRRFDPADQPIVSLALTSDTLGAPALTRLADPGITRLLRGIPGVAQVNVSGSLERQIVVQLDPEALAATDVSVGDVVAAVQRQNVAAPVGRVIEGGAERAIRLQGRLGGPADFRNIVVRQVGSNAVRLGSVAEVLDATEEARTAALYNGDRAVGIDVLKTTGYSTTTVSDQVIAQLEDIRATLPNTVELLLVRNAGERVKSSVRNVQQALIEGAALTVLVVFLFLNSWRSTVITGLALPVSVLASFVAVWAMGFTLNTMSLLGLTLAIGILIDDAIVVRENIVRHVQMGKSHLQASHDGTDEIGLAVTATTLSIVVVFIPVAFMGGLAQQWFAPMALTIVCSVLVSLFVSFSLDPMLSAYWPEPESKGKRAWITRKLDKFNNFFERQNENYARLISWSLKHRAVVLGLTTLIFAASMALPFIGAVGGSFFPITDDSEFVVSIETPPGASLDFTIAKARQVSQLARDIDEVRYTYTTLGGHTENVAEANVFVKLEPKGDRERSENEISSELRTQIDRVLGLQEGAIAAGGMDQQKEIQLRVSGHDLERLNAVAERIAEEVRQVEGAVDVGLSTSGRKPELEIDIDRGLASRLGISAADIATTLRPAFAGIDVGDWVDPSGETRDVYVRLQPEARSNIMDLKTLPLAVPGAPAAAPPQQPVVSRPESVPLGQVADIRQAQGPAQIEHVDRDRVITVEANTAGAPLNDVVSAIGERLATLDLPSGYSVSPGGNVQDQQEVFGRIFIALAVALGLMYLVLVVQFESFIDPLSILVTLPLSLIGVMLALWVTGGTINLMSLIGVILLMGIVVKNAILLIDFAKWSEKEGRNREDAIVEAGRVRLRPILMTSFSLVAGMAPVALGTGEGADFRAPMGLAIEGGVITSTFLTLLVIPVVYDIFSHWRDNVYAWVRSQLSSGGGTKPVPETQQPG